MLSDETTLLLALQRLEQLPEAQLVRLLNAVDSVADIVDLGASELLAVGLSSAAQAALTRLLDEGPGLQLNRDVEYLQQHQITLVSLASDDYPELLKQIAPPPPLLYARGNCALLNRPQLAMVGSRKTSQQGLENAYSFARVLAASGMTISSGLAAGIDARCHQGALDAGGDTLAVLGTGIDGIYPAGNRALFAAIGEHGLLLSEFPLGTPPRRQNFPRRNRIISGMSLAVLVVEAALKSGSLITARLALEQNRDVLAIPSSIHDPGGRGSNALIKQGATLVETAADVLVELQGWLPLKSVVAIAPLAPNSPGVNDRERQLLDYMGFDLASIDLLQQRSGWPTSELTALLTTLELKGRVEACAGRFRQLSPAPRG
ncbi:MAG: DNA processing protein [Paraglaciecola psychrophila]|jgi:DNA processing protein